MVEWRNTMLVGTQDVSEAARLFGHLAPLPYGETDVKPSTITNLGFGNSFDGSNLS